MIDFRLRGNKKEYNEKSKKRNSVNETIQCD